MTPEWAYWVGSFIGLLIAVAIPTTSIVATWYLLNLATSTK